MAKLSFASVLLLGCLCGAGGRAEASSFAVSPIKVVLSGKDQSALLSLQNQSGETLRFKVVAQEWAQSPAGEMQLKDSKDIVVYPTLLTLAPNAERKLRLGSTVVAGAQEKSYRVFVEELPALKSAQEPSKSEVRVLTKMGVPVFVEPANPVLKGNVEGARWSNGALAFSVKNAGNVHFLLQTVRVKLIDAAGASLLEKTLEGWYLLAGGTRLWQLEIPKDLCTRAKALSVDVQAAEIKFSGRLDLPGAGCSP